VLGKVGSKNLNFRNLIGPEFEQASQEIAETFEQIIDEEEELDDEKADLMYLKLLHRLVKLYLDGEKIQLKVVK
jgi:hypothetical protein